MLTQLTPEHHNPDRVNKERAAEIFPWMVEVKGYGLRNVKHSAMQAYFERWFVLTFQMLTNQP